MNFIDQFRAARRASIPIIAIRTPDPTSTMSQIFKLNNDAPLVFWDIVRGLVGLNGLGTAAAEKVLGGQEAAMLTNPVEMLTKVVSLPPKSVLFFANGHRYIVDPAVMQAVWNLRDIFKQDRRTLAITCPTITLPTELNQDVLILDEPLPNTEQLANIVTETYLSASLPVPKPDVVALAVDAICGLSAFSAEQVCAMSITKEKGGIDVEALWERKRQTIEQTPGLSVWRGKETFKSIAGLRNIKQYTERVLKGKRQISCVLFIDEIEKMLAGAAGDLSGVTQEMLGTFLTWMQDKNVVGILLIGHPGTGKSLLAKAAGNEAGIPTITFDVSGMKASLIGESGANLRMALKVVDAVAGGKAKFVIATCNSIGSLPPELRRRFKSGTFFMDLPDAEERESAWQYYLGKYELSDQNRPTDQEWTGAEIEQCCELAWSLDIKLSEAAEYVVPVAQASSENVEKLRTLANGRFISASKPGKYRREVTAAAAAQAGSKRRAIN